MGKIFRLLFFLLIIFAAFSFSAAAQKPELVIPIGNPAEVTTIAISPDGKYIASGGYDHCIKLWDIATGDNLKSFDFHSDHVTSILFTPDSQSIISAGRDSVINCFNFRTGEISYTLKGHKRPISTLALSKNGRYLLSGGWDGLAKLWDTQNKKCIATFHCGKNIQWVGFSPDEKNVFISSKSDSTISIWSVRDTVAPSTVIQFSFAKVGYAVIADTVLICGSNETDTIRFLDLKKLDVLTSNAGTAKPYRINVEDLCIRRIFFEGGAYSIALSNKGNMLAAGGGKKFGSKVCVWNLKTLDPNPTKVMLGHTEEVRALCFAPEDTFLLSGSYDRTMISWDYLPDTVKKIMIFKGHTGLVRYVEWSGDDKNLLVGYYNNSIPKLFNLQNNYVTNLTGNDTAVTALNFSPDNNHFITEDALGKNMLWEIDSIDYSKNNFSNSDSLFVSTFKNKVSYILSKKGDSLIYCDNSKTLRIRDLKTNKIDSSRKIKFNYELIDFSYDLEYIVYTDSLSNMSSITVLKNDSLVKILKTSQKYIMNLMLSPDKKFIISLSYDTLSLIRRRFIPYTVDIWDLKSLEKIKFSVSDSAVDDFRYFPNTSLLLTSRKSGTVDLWDMTSLKYEQSYSDFNCEMRSVFISGNKKLILLGGKDGKLIFVDFRTQKELATLTLLDSNDWVVTTPSGLYDATPGALEKMHYIVGLTPVKLSQLNHEYSQANLLKIMLGYNSEHLKNVPPFDSVAFYPECKLTLKENMLMIKLNNKGGGFGKVSVFMGSKKIIEDARIFDSLKTKEERIVNIDMDKYSAFLYDTINVIKVICENEKGSLKSLGDTVHYMIHSGAKGSVTRKITGSTEVVALPALYALIVGTSHYASSSIDLMYADKDAIDFASAIEKIGKSKFGDTMVFVSVLSTDTSTELSSKENILKEIKTFTEKMNPRDIFILYFSGHGSTANGSEGEFYYLTRASRFSNVELLSEDEKSKIALSTHELIQAMDSIRAQRKILIMDACESGSLTHQSFSLHDIPAGKKWNLEELGYNTGTYILAGSLSSQSSYETSMFKQGLLTYTLLKGIKGAALKTTGECTPVNIVDLFEYAVETVPLLAKKINGIQQPLPLIYGPNFSIGCATTETKQSIKIKDDIKMFSSVYIFPVNRRMITDDTLNLTRIVKNYLIEQTTSATSKIAYISYEDYPDSYSIKGSYHVGKNNQLELRYQISQNNRPIVTDKTMTTTIGKADINNLASELMKQILLDIEVKIKK
jgi:WD40 repeat protein